MNVECYPSSLFPLRGDLSAEAGATTVEVIGLQDVLIAPQPFIDAAVLTFVSANQDLEWIVPIFNYDNTFFVSLVAGDVLVYNGTEWTNAPFPTLAQIVNPFRFESSNYELLTGVDYFVTFTSPATATLNSLTAVPGTAFEIKTTSGQLTITPTSGTIDGSANAILTVANSAVKVIFDGTNWEIQ